MSKWKLLKAIVADVHKQASDASDYGKHSITERRSYARAAVSYVLFISAHFVMDPADAIKEYTYLASLED